MIYRMTIKEEEIPSYLNQIRDKMSRVQREEFNARLVDILYTHVPADTFLSIVDTASALTAPRTLLDRLSRLY